jgi:excisionase family DNA binding protein
MRLFHTADAVELSCIKTPSAGSGHGQILTVAEVALELRCSKAHVYNVIAGKVDGVRALPAISMGRRKLVRRAALEHWMEMNEVVADDGNIASSSAIDTVGRMKERVHA